MTLGLEFFANTHDSIQNMNTLLFIFISAMIIVASFISKEIFFFNFGKLKMLTAYAEFRKNRIVSAIITTQILYGALSYYVIINMRSEHLANWQLRLIYSFIATATVSSINTLGRLLLTNKLAQMRIEDALSLALFGVEGCYECEDHDHRPAIELKEMLGRWFGQVKYNRVFDITSTLPYSSVECSTEHTRWVKGRLITVIFTCKEDNYNLDLLFRLLYTQIEWVYFRCANLEERRTVFTNGSACSLWAACGRKVFSPFKKPRVVDLDISYVFNFAVLPLSRCDLDGEGYLVVVQCYDKENDETLCRRAAREGLTFN